MAWEQFPNQANSILGIENSDLLRVFTLSVHLNKFGDFDALGNPMKFSRPGTGTQGPGVAWNNYNCVVIYGN